MIMVLMEKEYVFNAAKMRFHLNVLITLQTDNRMELVLIKVRMIRCACGYFGLIMADSDTKKHVSMIIY